jgi:regulator of protease activity HflC (stomatin/prohibitin superfamily)
VNVPGAGPDLKSVSRRIFNTRGGRLLYLLVAGSLFFLVAYNTCTVYVGPNEFALKQVTVGVNKGIGDTVYTAGVHWVTPGTERMLTFPTDLQVLTLSNDQNEKPLADSRSAPALNIQTSEGYNVTVDTTVVYRIADPFKVYKSAGPGKLYETSLVVPRSEQILRKRLGELDAEEFYNAAKRIKQADLAMQDLNGELEPNGIHIHNVFVRRYVYDDRYQQAIEQRKIQDQTVFKNKAEAELATATAEKDRIVAQGQATVKVELARGDAEKAKVDAEAELYERTQRAEGQKELDLAEAEGTRLEAAAQQGQGSEYRVGLEMAEALRGTKVIVIPTDGEGGTNPLDLKSALKRFDVTP